MKYVVPILRSRSISVNYTILYEIWEIKILKSKCLQYISELYSAIFLIPGNRIYIPFFMILLICFLHWSDLKEDNSVNTIALHIANNTITSVIDILVKKEICSKDRSTSILTATRLYTCILQTVNSFMSPTYHLRYKICAVLDFCNLQVRFDRGDSLQ